MSVALDDGDKMMHFYGCNGIESSYHTVYNRIEYIIIQSSTKMKMKWPGWQRGKPNRTHIDIKKHENMDVRADKGANADTEGDGTSQR